MDIFGINIVEHPCKELFWKTEFVVEKIPIPKRRKGYRVVKKKVRVAYFMPSENKMFMASEQFAMLKNI